jgi:selenobiotic family peptide radical SAM maturase
MKVEMRKLIEKIYPQCRSEMHAGPWNAMIDSWPEDWGPDELPDVLAFHADEASFLPDLARLEWAVWSSADHHMDPSVGVNQLTVNPTLSLLQLSWRRLPLLIQSGMAPEKGEEFLLVYRVSGRDRLLIRSATDDDLLALKLVAEGISSRRAAAQGEVPVAQIDAALNRAVQNGLLLAPPSDIQRNRGRLPIPEGTEKALTTVSVFTLQWHITQACDLHCKHCYDRTQRKAMTHQQGLRVLNDFYDFCKSRNVAGQVSFTGGNPFLHPDFVELYKAASDFGLSLAILGNPAQSKQLEPLMAIEPPLFYQVSLEGLREHNDLIRGDGHFDRTMVFLDLLRELEIYSMVMLTLTRDNMDQILPLAEWLQGKCDLFTFNRLSMVGGGTRLQLPSKEDYIRFLNQYLEASEKNPVIGLKDNLINILLKEADADLFGGCAGFGCGAAFNFLSVLPDGEVHACRKFPSPVGNLYHQSIAEIYDCEMAERYRSGSSQCRSCAIRLVCGGCLAVSYSSGLNIFEERDPFCFMDTADRAAVNASGFQKGRRNHQPDP